MPAQLTTRAPAKINLNLIVHGRRADGYHELSSLVMFAGVSDVVSLDPARPVGLSITGRFAAGLEVDDSNLVLRAAANLAARLPELRSGHFSLTKRLPVASGIGGGSADAAAALRLLVRLNGLHRAHPAVMLAACETGADVPVCLGSHATTMRGTGELLGLRLDLPRLFAVLVNPGVAVPTARVFLALKLNPGEMLRRNAGEAAADDTDPWHADGPEDAEGLMATLKRGHGNDLEDPARRLAPEIDTVLESLDAADGCRLARMSGSGATCFGLFGSATQSAKAARQISARHPEWWVKATVLR
ncbi:MAG: 4-(cytidine 5'-diphospho)-2-C-methyl-D-erythritol kinase [Bosea sp. (in: a-proteobacteria)]